MQTMQQKRAKYALEAVQKAIDDRRVNQKEYKAYAANLPAMIHMNGLGQAVAFFKSKGNGKDSKAKAYLSIYNTLSDWLCGNVDGAKTQPYTGSRDLLEGITNKDMQHYQVAQAEAQALMDWVKKFAKAFMDSDEKTDNKGGES